jgi:TRAP-type mannitol/chloroaromatic compound transport system permease large subunit
MNPARVQRAQVATGFHITLKKNVSEVLRSLAAATRVLCEMVGAVTDVMTKSVSEAVVADVPLTAPERYVDRLMAVADRAHGQAFELVIPIIVIQQMPADKQGPQHLITAAI